MIKTINVTVPENTGKTIISMFGAIKEIICMCNKIDPSELTDEETIELLKELLNNAGKHTMV